MGRMDTPGREREGSSTMIKWHGDDFMGRKSTDFVVMKEHGFFSTYSGEKMINVNQTLIKLFD